MKTAIAVSDSEASMLSLLPRKHTLNYEKVTEIVECEIRRHVIAAYASELDRKAEAISAARGMLSVWRSLSLALAVTTDEEMRSRFNADENRLSMLIP
ncbi:hypothetical protein [Burkholderia sp. Tr-20390]|uniref:hypothetical protein n=1 Tax=Burkholderia sp. Tr-20390 TaxID=2703904 RepID=UPI001980D2D1|nr:hypothetical protein [Burkholderia sp. Tr-20390]MBN3733142.1 hypothetical protein [Burkholderia sp. Tr-20390]